MTGTFLPPSRPEPSPQMLALKIRRDYRHQRLARSFTDASFAASARHPTTPRTPLAASPRPTRSRPRPVPPPIRAAPWLRSLALFDAGWLDSRAVRDARGPCSEKSPVGLAPGNASRENIATASQAKSALGSNHATIGRWGAHCASILPSLSAREHIKTQSCHRQAPHQHVNEELA